MTPPVLLTAPMTLNTDLLHADCAKRHVPPLGVLIPHALGSSSTSTTPTSASECDAFDTETNRTLVRPWTGAPIRAIIPLPRRRLAALANGVQDAAAAPRSVTTVPCLTRAARFWDDTHVDSRLEIEDDDEEEEDTERVGPSGMRYCAYESITAAEGLAAWSFEELRVECYAQSLVARGTRPPPVVRPSLAIPPAFVPRIVPRS